jgi:2-amino-1-hydroxyethylphosphonate dioxygenase (glycine-forming)
MNASAESVIMMLEASDSIDYLGEDVSQLEHALQAAAAAERARATDEEILAALLHDVGHYCAPHHAGLGSMDGYGVRNHEQVAAAFLADLGFSETVLELVRGHVEAKRYLVWRNPGYARMLSAASTETLRQQGGAMSDAEGEAFERQLLFKNKLRLRSWDDQAKVPGLAVPGLEYYRERLERHLGRPA